MTPAPNPRVAITLRLYRALANAFPHEFKNVYGEELLQTTEDAIESIWRHHGLAGLVRLLLDIAIRIPAEYLAEIRQDVRYGLRMLAASPGFTAVALVSLSLGIAIGTAAYSEMQGIVLRDLPGVSKPDELVALQRPVSYPAYKHFRELTDLFSATAAYVAPVPFGVSVEGRTERTWGHLVTPSYFSTLGVRPLLGRFFDEGREQPGQDPLVVVSYRFWQSRLGSDPSINGKTLRINGHPATILGVGPKDFLGASPNIFGADLWMPIWVDARVAPELMHNALERHELTMFQMLARLKPGVASESAEAELDTVARKLEQDYGQKKTREKGRRVLLVAGGKVLPMRKQDLPFFTEFFIVIAGLVLLIACSNVANMMLARAADRRREIAVRLALGASRARLLRQLLTESMLIAAGAGVLGFLVAVCLMQAASRIKMPYPMPITLDLTPDWRALLFTLALTLFTGLAFGIAPAVQATRTDLTPALKEGGNVRLRRYRKLSLRSILMLSQVAASLTLLLLTGELSIGIQGALAVQQGINPRNLYLISLDPIRDGYSGSQAAAFFQKLLDRVQKLPSVTAACLTDTVPVALNGNAWISLSSPGSGRDASHVTVGARRYIVGKDYFDTSGIRMLLGRAFRKEDEVNEGVTVIVSEALANEFWKGDDPVGRRVDLAGIEAGAGFGIAPGTIDFRPGAVEKERRMFEVVGVAKDVAEGFTIQKPQPAIYFPLRPDDYAQPSLRGMTLMVRAAPGVDALGMVRREISALDANIVPYNARSMPEQVEQFMSVLRGAAWTYGVIGMVGLILASVGLAGVTAYSVAQRRREIGIRMALGARRNNVLGLVMKQGATVVVLGTAIGMTTAWAGMRVLSGLSAVVAKLGLGGSASRPMLLIGAPLLLAALALVACYLPARKSMRIDPAVTLRQE